MFSRDSDKTNKVSTSSSVIGVEMQINGNIKCCGNLVLKGKVKGKIKGKSIRLDSGAIVDAEITYEILAIEDGSSINGIVKKIVNPTPTKKQILPEDKKKEDK